MATIISGALLVLNWLASLGKKHSKTLAFLILFIAWILFWGSTNNADSTVYQAMYYSNAEITTESLELGFILLIKLGNFLNLNYTMFLALISTIGFVLIHKTVKEYTENYNFVYLLYFLYPLFFDVIQVRNFLMMSIIVFSTRYLIQKDSFKFILAIFFASTIHIASILYMPMILLYSKRNKSLVVSLIFFSLFISIITLMNDKKIPFSDSFINTIGIDKLDVYLSTNTEYGFLLFWGLQILSCLILWLSKEIINQNNLLRYKDTDKTDEFVTLIYGMNLLLIVYFPLYLLNSNFFRISRNLMLLNYIALSITRESFNKTNNKIIYDLLIYSYIGIFLIFNVFPAWERIIAPILNHNLIL